VVEPLGLFARKHQDLLGTWSKIIHDCAPDAGTLRTSLLKVTSARQHLTSKLKEIEYCYEHRSSLLHGIFKAERERKHAPKDTDNVKALLVSCPRNNIYLLPSRWAFGP
jgi:hypothetical protein